MHSQTNRHYENNGHLAVNKKCISRLYRVAFVLLIIIRIESQFSVETR